MKYFLGVILALIMAVVGIGYYFYTQIAFVPEWYKHEPPQNIKKMVKDGHNISREIRKKLKAGKPVKMSEAQVTALILSSMGEELSMNPNKIVKGIKTKLSENKLEVEAVVNLREFSKTKLPKKIQGLFNQILEVLPKDIFEEFYAKVEGAPITRNGRLGFDQSSFAQLGSVKYSVGDLASKIDKGKGTDGFIPLTKLPFSNISLSDGALVVNPTSKKDTS